MNLHALNEAQREAVTFFEPRPLVVVAGPGTGKTRVLTHRIQYLIEEKGISAQNILAITFTNHAAREISERISATAKATPKVTTFHAWAFELIKDEMGEKSPVLIDELDAYALFKEGMCLLEMGTKGAKKLFKEVGLLRQTYPEKTPTDTKIAALYHAYKALLYKYNVMDFDEILIRCMRLLESEGVLTRVKTKWPYILVDEFQDVNPIQFKIVETISTGNLTIIGDPNQSIYGFRGSDPKAMERFLERFKDAKVVRLDVAYRCHQEVLDCSSSVLVPNTSTVPPLRSQKGKGPKVILKGFLNPRDEAKWLVDKIEALTGALSFEAINFGRSESDENSHSLSDIAVLLRTRTSGRDIIEGLKRRGIPYWETQATPITQEPTARLLARLVAISQGGNTDFHKRRLREEARLKDSVIDECVALLRERDTRRLLELLNLDPDDPLIKGLTRWITSVPHPHLCTDVDLLAIDIHAIHIMTIHGAKGLEFPVVFIPRCDEEILPLKDSDENEERRLFYVAMTRAKEQVYITYSADKKSPFLNGLPDESYLEEILKTKKKRPRKKGPKQGTLF